MFSGIIEEMGVVQKIEYKKNLSVLHMCVRKILRGVKLGSSIAVNGTCLTVTAIKKNVLSFDLMKETLLKTSLGVLKPKCTVNLERALKVGGRLDGHFVTGHVDELGRIKKIVELENYTEFRIAVSKASMAHIVPKGSVAIDGVSLTIGDVKKTYFSVYLIPFTKEVTTLGVKKDGDPVNIETDVLAKYILKK